MYRIQKISKCVQWQHVVRCLLVLSLCPHESTSRDLSIIGNDRGWRLSLAFLSPLGCPHFMCLFSSFLLLHCMATLHFAFCILHSASCNAFLCRMPVCPHACISFYVNACILLTTLCSPCPLFFLPFFIVNLPSFFCQWYHTACRHVLFILPPLLLSEASTRTSRGTKECVLESRRTQQPASQVYTNVDTLKGKGEAKSDNAEGWRENRNRVARRCCTSTWALAMASRIAATAYPRQIPSRERTRTRCHTVRCTVLLTSSRRKINEKPAAL